MGHSFLLNWSERGFSSGVFLAEIAGSKTRKVNDLSAASRSLISVFDA